VPCFSSRCKAGFGSWSTEVIGGIDARFATPEEDEHVAMAGLAALGE
jgi:hypothetical protein